MRRRQAILLAMYPIKKRLFYPKPGEKVLRILRKKQREQLIRQEEAQNHLLLLQQQYRFEQPHSIITTHAPSTSSNSSQDSYRDTRSPNPIANLARCINNSISHKTLPTSISTSTTTTTATTIPFTSTATTSAATASTTTTSTAATAVTSTISNGTSFYFLLSQSPSYAISCAYNSSRPTHYLRMLFQIILTLLLHRLPSYCTTAATTTIPTK